MQVGSGTALPPSRDVSRLDKPGGSRLSREVFWPQNSVFEAETGQPGYSGSAGTFWSKGERPQPAGRSAGRVSHGLCTPQPGCRGFLARPKKIHQPAGMSTGMLLILYYTNNNSQTKHMHTPTRTRMCTRARDFELISQVYCRLPVLRGVR